MLIRQVRGLLRGRRRDTAENRGPGSRQQKAQCWALAAPGCPGKRTAIGDGWLIQSGSSILPPHVPGSQRSRPAAADSSQNAYAAHGVFTARVRRAPGVTTDAGTSRKSHTPGRAGGWAASYSGTQGLNSSKADLAHSLK